MTRLLSVMSLEGAMEKGQMHGKGALVYPNDEKFEASKASSSPRPKSRSRAMRAMPCGVFVRLVAAVPASCRSIRPPTNAADLSQAASASTAR